MSKYRVVLVCVLCACFVPSLLQAQSVADADFDASGTVDFADFLLFAGAFGGTNPVYDLDGNGSVDFPDFLLFASVFGQTTGASQSITVTSPAGTTHEMVEVSAGPFTMGSESGYSDERPVHTVTLDAYHIDKYEVTNAQYVAFINATGSNTDTEGHELLDMDDSYGQIRHTGAMFELKEDGHANLPVIAESWYGATAYCEWIGGRLPTEAEWEKAARGTDGRTYPWGSRSPTADLTNYNFNVGSTTDVGSYPRGVSPYGTLDMAGNVWEWVSDWNDLGYYSQSPDQDPQGPANGPYRVYRGGSWGSNSGFGSRSVRSAKRAASAPSTSGSGNLGFRCAIRL